MPNFSFFFSSNSYLHPILLQHHLRSQDASVTEERSSFPSQRFFRSEQLTLELSSYFTKAQSALRICSVTESPGERQIYKRQPYVKVKERYKRVSSWSNCSSVSVWEVPALMLQISTILSSLAAPLRVCRIVRLLGAFLDTDTFCRLLLPGAGKTKINCTSPCAQVQYWVEYSKVIRKLTCFNIIHLQAG